MGVERFDVLLRDAMSGATITREWSKAEMLKSVAWLKRMNARGNNISVRPSGEHGLAFLDSIKAGKLTRMSSKGFAPVISVEVSSHQFQAWVKLSDRALPEQLRRLAEAGLANAFGDSGDNVGHNGYGWLAGCVNHGRVLDVQARAKYVRAHAESGGISIQAKQYVDLVRNISQRMGSEHEQKIENQLLPEPAKPQARDR